LWQTPENTPPDSIVVALQWRGYRYAEANAFDIFARITFYMSEFVYRLYSGPEEKQLLTKRYDQAVSEEELTEITTWYVEYMMREIASRVSRSLH
jgi:hypothetical protein